MRGLDIWYFLRFEVRLICYVSVLVKGVLSDFVNGLDEEAGGGYIVGRGIGRVGLFINNDLRDIFFVLRIILVFVLNRREYEIFF